MNKFLDYPTNPFKIEISDKKIDPAILVIALTAKPEVDKKKKSEEIILPEFPYFKASPGELVEAKEQWHVGLGVLKEKDLDALGQLFMNIASKVSTRFAKIQIVIPRELEKLYDAHDIANLLITAFGISCYPVDLMKSKPSAKNVKLKSIQIKVNPANVTKWRRATSRYLPLTKHINAMRQIQALPGNILTAESFEKRSRLMAKQFGLKIKVYKKDDLEKMGAGGILAVNQGSVNEPRMIVVEYDPLTNTKKKKATKETGKKSKIKTLALVGKGVTFDTGGISLKPPSDMHEMKYDMSGASATLHAVAAIAELGLNVKVVAVMGLVENMPDGAALKPGDVYTSLKGHTIEVQNTDAEGRLVLADLLHHAEKKFKPDLMIDLATLTGAIVVALGSFYAGLFTTSKKAKDTIEQSAKESLEPVWQMPMSKQFKDMLKSDIADYNNIGGRYGGSSSAAAFLSLFVDKKENWAHLDIAGIGFIKKSFNVYPSVATGYGIRLLTEIASSLS